MNFDKSESGKSYLMLSYQLTKFQGCSSNSLQSEYLAIVDKLDLNDRVTGRQTDILINRYLFAIIN